MPDKVFPLLTGFDRADGVTATPAGVMGTPTPDDSILVQSTGDIYEVNGIILQEDPDSPTIERAEQCTVRHRFTMSWKEAKERIILLGRGTLLKDSGYNVYFVLSASIQHQRGGLATLELVTEAKSFDPPPDEWDIQPVELGLNIIKHPRYFRAFMGENGTDEQRNQMVIRLLQNYMDNPSYAYRDALIWMLDKSMNNAAGYPVDNQPPYYVEEDDAWYQSGGVVGKVAGTNMAKAAAMEIVSKYWRGEESPYIVGWQITWSQYAFLPWVINGGGYIEDPITEGGLAPYIYETFLSKWPHIFDALDEDNPQAYSVDGKFDGGVNISWLRKADHVEYQRTWHRITRTWIGSPVGFWDADIYKRGDGPQTAADYNIPYATLKYNDNQS